jgi:hypothetical protein
VTTTVHAFESRRPPRARHRSGSVNAFGLLPTGFSRATDSAAARPRDPHAGR